ncbi:MAG: UPF0175 family protein [Candidatus Diapherotrites archaeon]|nr:UPF0175 family protein [Candidatus Diapherotrites archaeon]
MKTVSMRVEESQLKIIQELGNESGLDLSGAFRKVLDTGLQKTLLDQAVEKYSNGEVSLWKSAELAKVSLRKMQEELSRRGIDAHYSQQSFEEDTA